MPAADRPWRRSLAGRLTLGVAVLVVATATLAAALAWWGASALLVFGGAAAVGLAGALVWTARTLGGVTSTLQALKDGVSSFRDNDFSMRLAVLHDDELGDLLGLYNEMGDALRAERHDIYQRELLLDTMLQGVPVAIVLASARDRVVYANRAARELLGGSKRLEGHAFGELLATCPSEMQGALAAGNDALFTVTTTGEEETYRTVRRSFHLNARPHALYLIERLTPELRRREVEVWKNAIRIMNHELNNSLAPIRSLVHSARHILDRPEHAHRLPGIFDTLEERATHLALFLESYATFARLPRPRKEPASWAELLDGVRRLYPFRLDGAPPAEAGHFDVSQIHQVLINLVKNARESGGPEDEVTVSVHSAGAGGTVIRVEDRGQGMDDETMKLALLPFHSSKPSGSGLGLALCREILEAHGGRVSMHRRDGGGMTVTCWLP